MGGVIEVGSGVHFPFSKAVRKRGTSFPIASRPDVSPTSSERQYESISSRFTTDAFVTRRRRMRTSRPAETPRDIARKRSTPFRGKFRGFFVRYRRFRSEVCPQVHGLIIAGDVSIWNRFVSLIVGSVDIDDRCKSSPSFLLSDGLPSSQADSRLPGSHLRNGILRLLSRLDGIARKSLPRHPTTGIVTRRIQPYAK